MNRARRRSKSRKIIFEKPLISPLEKRRAKNKQARKSRKKNRK